MCCSESVKSGTIRFYFHMVELNENILVTVRVLHNVKRGYSNNSDVKYDFIVAKE